MYPLLKKILIVALVGLVGWIVYMSEKDLFADEIIPTGHPFLITQ